MAKLRVKAPDGKTLVVEVPAGTAPSQYDDLARSALTHYAQAAVDSGDKAAQYWREHGDYPEAGEEKPPEQRAAEMAVEIGNTAGGIDALPGMVKGAVGLGMKAAGAISKGLAEPLESASNWLGGRVLQPAKSVLPKDALAGYGKIEDASEWAMNPHPEVQEALNALKKAPAAAATSTEMAPASQSLVKAGGDADAAAAAPAAETGGDALNNPILSMDNMSTRAQLEAADAHRKIVGGAIAEQLQQLNQTGKMYDPTKTVENLAGMYKRNASGSIIANDGSEQALFNQAVSDAIATVKAEAKTDEGIIKPISWDAANRIKGALQNLGNYEGKGDAEDMIYKVAASAVREDIDTQAQAILAANGGDVQNFQTLRNAYSKILNVKSFLNEKARSEMSMKNVLPVVRTMAGMMGAVAGAATHGPVGALIGAGLPAVEYGVRELGPIMAARGLKNAANIPAALSKTGAGLTAASGGVSNAARGIANGLALDMNEAQ